MNNRNIWSIGICLTVFGLLSLFQNCSKNFEIVQSGNSSSAASQLSVSTGRVVVGPSKANPPIDLFFIVDNSASMLEHQIDLGKAFASIFNSNSASLSNFDVNIYLFSTASTVNQNYAGQLPSAMVTSLPALTDTPNLAKVPGSIFGLKANFTGTYGQVPYKVEIEPAPVLGVDSTGNVRASLSIQKRGNQSLADYSKTLSVLTSEFQQRLANLDPTNQLSYSSATDVSSGLCSMARILKHANDFVKPGDSAAFIIVSDDNDRLGVRNANGNVCAESLVGAETLQDGTCGHYESTFNYNTTATLKYNSSTNFTYSSGTTVSYKYPTSENCAYSYANGYNYNYTFTKLQTLITYTRCDQMADGFCVKPVPGAVTTITGNYSGANNSCTKDVSTLVSSPAPGSSFSCQSANLDNQTGAPGVDSKSDGSNCSSDLLTQLSSDVNKTNIVCVIGAPSTATNGSASNQALNSCVNYCSAHSIPGCSLLKTTTNYKTGSLALTSAGLSCSSQCPDSTKCGAGSIASYVTATYGSAASCSTSAVNSTVTVDGAIDASGNAFSCNSPLTGRSVSSNGTVVCKSSATVQDCINSLQAGAACKVSGNGQSSVTVAANVSCNTNCSDSMGYCSDSNSTVAQYLAQQKGAACVSSSNGGGAVLKLKFNANVAQTASCTSKCSDVLSGSCDGSGYGSLDGSTVADYIKDKLKGATTCTSSVQFVADSAVISVDATQTGTACTDPSSPVFSPKGTPHPAPLAINNISGSTPLKDFIVSQASQVFGVNGVAFATITHLPTDSLSNTDVGQSYIDLAQSLGSNKISSITGDYSSSLASISQFIVTASQNNFALPLKDGETVLDVSIIRKSTGQAESLDGKMWSYSGQTLSISPSAKLQIGDEIEFDYR